MAQIVTLITGDRVTLQGDKVTIASTRKGVTFQATSIGGVVRVVPSDVVHLIGNVLDPQLFDVTVLARSGYRDSQPLIVQGSGVQGGGVQGQLRSINATVTSTKELREFKGKIWLDARVHTAAADHPSQNLAQIGAPAAWNAGLTGTGVRIAVLDTGIDATHPDLAGRVVGAKNFTESPFTTDRHGHGTHVASIAAGSQGVAFDASLLSGKVLDDDGSGQFSDIIAGMEWAVEQGARVVNMSLSSNASSNGQDPLSLAVDALTASHGTLFVTAAGNRGPSASIGSPGAAEAALTVGAVDKHDRLADFSSRGPRFGDYGMKPDLVAPGVDILAARAAGTELGDPAGSRYTRLSGTSMAAPHVAGAAALLAQQHPKWTATTLKPVLAGASASVEGGPFEVGAGRVELSNAIRQRVHAHPVNFGFVPYPQSGAGQRTLTFTNTGNLASLLRLSGTLSVSPPWLVVPAGGKAEATVTMTTALTGEVIARQVGGPAVRVPVGVVKEGPHHLLHLNAIDRDGGNQIETLAWLANLGDLTASPADPVLLQEGKATVRVPDGFYTITAAIPTIGEGEPPPDDDPVVTSISIATVAEVAVSGDTTVTLDARRAKPISAAVSGVSTVPVDVHVFVAARDRKENSFVLAYATSAQDVVEGKLFIEPTTPVRHGRLELSSKWRLDTVGGAATYDLLFAGPTFPSSLDYVVAPRQLATIRTTYRIPASLIGYQEGRFVFTEVNPVSIAVFQPGPEAPARRTEYLNPGNGWIWFQCANVIVSEEGLGGYCQPQATFKAGKTIEQGWLRAPLRSRAAAFRTPTHLQFGIDDLADDGTAGSLSSHIFDKRSFALYRNGVLIKEGTDPLGVHRVPLGAAAFRLTRKLEMRPDLLALSPRVETSWTFTSTPPAGDKPPTEARLLDVTVHVPVDDRNSVAAGPVRLSVEVERGVAFTLDVSTDDGLTWQRVQQGTVVLPEGMISLRTNAWDGLGNRTEQTVIRAFSSSAAAQGG